MINLTKRRGLYFLLSMIIISLGLASLLLPHGLKLGIEFTSGSTMTVRFDQGVKQGELREVLRDSGYGRAIIQGLGGNTFLLRTPRLSLDEKEALEKIMTDRLGSLKVLEFYDVSPIVAKEIGRNTGIAIAAASIGILLYIAWAFRRVPPLLPLGKLCRGSSQPRCSRGIGGLFHLRSTIKYPNRCPIYHRYLGCGRL